MGYTDPFWLGPVGRLIELPSPVAGGFPAPYERAAAEQRSLAGGLTVDVFGAHRSWEFEFSYRHGGEAHRLIARWTSPIVSEPLRLIDPLTPNRLSLDAAATGGVSAVGGTNAANGAVTRTRVTDPPAEVAGLLEAAFRWVPPADSGELALDAVDRVPVLAGETAEFRVYARGTTSVTPFVRSYTLAGATSDSDGAAVALSSSAWTPVAHSVAVAADTVAVVPGVKTGAGLADPLVELCAAVLTTDPEAEGWSPGGGAPVVAVTGFEHGHQRLGRRAMTLVVREV